MAGKLSLKSWDRFSAMGDIISSISAQCQGFNMNDLADLVRRDASGSPVPDGLERSGDAPPSMGHSASSPTERAAMARMTGRPSRNIVREEVRGIENDLRTAEAAVHRAHQRIHLLKFGEFEARGSDVSTPCNGCQILPIRETGLCELCIADWKKAGRPDRFLWTAWKSKALSGDNELLVSDEPKNPAIRVTRRQRLDI